MKPQRTWYLVMNSNRARILRDLPGAREPIPVEITMQGRRRHMAEIVEDRPARSFASSGGGRRSAVEPGSDPLLEDARNFLREVQDFLAEQSRARAFDGLVVIAPADTMGLWRSHVPEELQGRVTQEFIRNLIPFSARELVAAIRALTSNQT